MKFTIEELIELVNKYNFESENKLHSLVSENAVKGFLISLMDIEIAKLKENYEK